MIRYHSLLIWWSLISALLLNRIVAQNVEFGEPFSTIRSIDRELIDLSDKIDGLLDKTSQIESTSNSSQYELLTKMESIIDINTNVCINDIKGFVKKLLTEQYIPEMQGAIDVTILEMERLWAEGYIPLMQSVFDASKMESESIINASKIETNQIWTEKYIPQMQDAINASKEEIEVNINVLKKDVNTLKGCMSNVGQLESLLSSSQEVLVSKMENIEASREEMEMKIGGQLESLLSSSQEVLVSKMENIEASREEMEEKIDGLTSDINSMKGMLNYVLCEAKANCLLYEDWSYTISDTLMSWQDSRQHCQDKGGDLVHLTTNEEFTMLKGKLSPEDRYWVGLNDIKSEGSFVWVDDGSAHNLDTHKSWWREGEPNNSGDEDCGEIPYFEDNNLLNDIGCNEKQRFVCKFNLKDMTF